ncbi:uncharacterized protein BN751_01135 [Coprococcus eutactus CAG:665]|nr:uncharacterized protein BN751_01135 [Coprococcus eutactus CAG:665]
MGVKTGNIIEIDKNGRDELYYPPIYIESLV